jgi:RNA polymerase sigma-54 factor
MALTQRLQIRQSQALVMTPQLMQAIKLLQLSNLDLVAYVEAELERNPLLDRSAEDERPADRPNDTAAPEEASAGGEAWNEGEGLANGHSIDERLDISSDDVFPDDAAPVRPRTADIPAGYSEWAAVGAGGRDDGDYNLEAFVSSETTLADWLREQLTLAVADPARRMIGIYLIDLVDEAGYLGGDLAAVAEKLGTSIGEVEAVLGIVQGFDPPGIAARDLAECLALQLKERNRFDPAMEALIARLDLLARREFAVLKKICGVGDEDLADMIAEIRRLNPKPGLAFGSALVQPIVPDVFVRPGPDGGWIVELNSDTLPKVLVNQSYYAEVSATARRDTEKSYLADCLQNATWLVRALDQRARTILKVANEIVRQQDGFFARGVEHLRPLNLKTVAEAIGMHESTVSRVTANKYMATSRGIFELK